MILVAASCTSSSAEEDQLYEVGLDKTKVKIPARENLDKTKVKIPARESLDKTKVKIPAKQ